MIRVHSDVEAVGENLLGEGGTGKEDEEEEDSEEEEAGGCGGRPSGELLQFAQKLPDKIRGNQCTLVATITLQFIARASSSLSLGLTQAIIRVLLFPPKES